MALIKAETLGNVAIELRGRFSVREKFAVKWEFLISKFDATFKGFFEV